MLKIKKVFFSHNPQNHEEPALLPIREPIQEFKQKPVPMNQQIIGNEHPEVENQARRGPG